MERNFQHMPQVAKSENLDAWVRHVIDTHFHPASGTPFWIGREKELGIDARGDIGCCQDRAWLGFFPIQACFGANMSGFFPLIEPLVNCFAFTNEQGAQTSIYPASSPEVERITGKYFVKCRAERSFKESYDRVAAERLWNIRAAMTGLAEG